jgi:hypothetical protein
VRFPLLLASTSLIWSPLLAVLSEGVDARAEALGYALGSISRVEPEAPTPPLFAPGEGVVEEVVELDEAAPGDVAEPKQTRGGGTISKRKASGKKSAQKPLKVVPKRGLRVREKTVLALANARAMPDGSYTPPADGHPGGMRLSNVARFGVGLRDGDVLSHVQGVPAVSRGAVVSAVMQSRAARAPAVSAIFWRDGEPWRLVVEMPYLKKKQPKPTGGEGPARVGPNTEIGRQASNRETPPEPTPDSRASRRAAN